MLSLILSIALLGRQSCFAWRLGRLTFSSETSLSFRAVMWYRVPSVVQHPADTSLHFDKFHALDQTLSHISYVLLCSHFSLYKEFCAVLVVKFRWCNLSVVFSIVPSIHENSTVTITSFVNYNNIQTLLLSYNLSEVFNAVSSTQKC